MAQIAAPVQIVAANQNPHILPSHYPIPFTVGTRSECNIQGCRMDLRYRNGTQDHPEDRTTIEDHMRWHTDQQRLQYNLPRPLGVPTVWPCRSVDSGDEWCNHRMLHGLTNLAKLRHYMEHQDRRPESSAEPAIRRIGARDRRKLGTEKPIPSVFVGYLHYERYLPQRDRHIVRASIGLQKRLTFRIHVSDDNDIREGRLGAVVLGLQGPPGQPAPVPPVNLTVADPRNNEIEFIDAFLTGGAFHRYKGHNATYSDIMRLCRKGNEFHYCNEDGGYGLMCELLPSISKRKELIERMVRDVNSRPRNVARGRRLLASLDRISRRLAIRVHRQYRVGSAANEWLALNEVHMWDRLD